MSEPFHTKLAFALRALSLSRGALAAEMCVDKSVIGRWARGAVQPSSHNLARLSEHVGRRVDGFKTLDWERPLPSLALLFGADPETAPTPEDLPTLVLPLMGQNLMTTTMRGGAYEGFFRTTRPYAQHPGQFVHDYVLMRRGRDGMLEFNMINSGVRVVGNTILLENKLFIVASDLTSGVMAFAIINGVSTVQAGRLDGVMLFCALDPTRTPTATVVVIDRVGDLSEDPDADDERFEAFGRENGLPATETIPAEVLGHLSRGVGADQLPGSEWLMNVTMARSLSGGLQTIG